MPPEKDKHEPLPEAVQPEAGMTDLSVAALELFKAKRVAKPAYAASAIAREAFADAAAFLAEEERIRNGGTIDAPNVATPPVRVTIELWDNVAMKPQMDEFGRRVTQEAYGDPWAYAPNLPAEHPINQKYYKARKQLGMPLVEPMFADVAGTASSRN